MVALAAALGALLLFEGPNLGETPSHGRSTSDGDP